MESRMLDKLSAISNNISHPMHLQENTKRTFPYVLLTSGYQDKQLHPELNLTVFGWVVMPLFREHWAHEYYFAHCKLIFLDQSVTVAN